LNIYIAPLQEIYCEELSALALWFMMLMYSSERIQLSLLLLGLHQSAEQCTIGLRRMVFIVYGS